MCMSWWKTTLVIIGAVVITALGIDASDTFNGSTDTLLSQVIRGKEGVCPSGMIATDIVAGVRCVDAYEASPGQKCPTQNPEQMLATQNNMSAQECVSQSASGMLPWRFVTRDQAMQLCARSGKRLPTSEEWYALSLSTVQNEEACNVRSGNAAKTGAYADCTAGGTVYDLVGNVWEWVSGDVVNGFYNDVTLPQSGFVSQVSSQGTVISVTGDAQDLFGKDYFWSRHDGTYGIIRGGYYDSASDAGIYTMHADTAPTTASAGVGFRCVL